MFNLRFGRSDMKERGTRGRHFVDLPVAEAASRRDELTIVDVREPAELTADGCIGGACNVPLGHLLRGAAVPIADYETPILVVCRSGSRSMQAFLALAARGFTRVHNLSEGMLEWRATGLPTGEPSP